MTNEPRPADAHEYPGGVAACLEAVLMAVDAPQRVPDLARALHCGEPEVEAALEGLRAAYDEQGRGFELRRTAAGWRFASRADYEPVVAAFVADGQPTRLSQAAMEALAIIAYQQPVTRAQVAAIRGVNSDGVIRLLSVHGLIRQDGVDPQSHAALLVTSDAFLDRMGLDSLDRLPSLAPLLPGSVDDVDPDGDPAGMA